MAMVRPLGASRGRPPGGACCGPPGPLAVTGSSYVLSDNGIWLVVLADSTRTIHYYRSAQVTAQQICQIEPRPRTQPLIPLYPAHLQAPTTTPVCAGLLTGRPDG